MTEKQLLSKVPQSFTAYDVLCYIVPGGLFFLCTYLTEFWAIRLSTKPADGGLKLHTPIVTALSSLADKLNAAPWAYSALFLVIVACLVYVVGHVIASISSFFLDRVFVTKAFGYPYAQLLGIPPYRRSRTTVPFYRSFFLWLNVYLVFRFVFIFAGTALHGSWVELFGGGILRFLEWLLVGSVVLKVLTSAKYGRADGRRRKIRRWMMKRWLVGFFEWVLRWVLHWPFDAVNGLMSKYTRDDKPFSEDFVASYSESFKREFGRKYRRAGTDNYWLPFLFVRETSENSAELVNNWHRLYSFARNVATGFYLSFLYALLWVFFQKAFLVKWARYSSYVLMVIPLIFLLAAFLMLLRYRYLYSQYYTKFILRAFVFHSREKRPV